MAIRHFLYISKAPLRAKTEQKFGRLDNAALKCQIQRVLAEKYEQLRRLLDSYGSCLVAYSGGVDSAFLACVAHDVLGEKSIAVIADSPSLPRRELDEALAIAEQFHIPVRVIQTQEFENPQYLSNPNNRCYFCKHELFTQLVPLAKATGFGVIAYGENASDVGDYRPGAQAASEFRIHAPLKEAGLTKSDIRQLSAQLGLPTADKPQMACLSSRIPYGEPVTEEKLRMIEQAENVIRDLGFYDVRVRHHELIAASNLQVAGSQSLGQPPESGNSERLASPIRHLARIEIGVTEISKFLADGLSAKVADALSKIGYAHVTLDLRGYRRGSLNKNLKA